MEKEFFINAVQLVDIEGATNVPTVLLYKGGAPPIIGSRALSDAQDTLAINEDFKIDLGNIDPVSTASRRKFPTASGFLKSASELTADFLHELVKYSRQWLSNQGMSRRVNVLVAEPLAMQTGPVSEGWVTNYRANIRRILAGKDFAGVEFLPEPFAVYQYYRHGLRHPLVAQRQRKNACVIDFGGGTCDICLIQTTKEGDIGIKGKLANPLSAVSAPVGGFFVNRLICWHLFNKIVPKNLHGKLNKAMDAYDRWRRQGDDLSSIAPEYASFSRHFHEFIYRCENLKLSLCRSIQDWGLDSELRISASISIPQDPFSDSSSFASVSLGASDLRELFVERVWKQRLLGLLRQALERGKPELKGSSISVVLLSGGSANIGWLRELIRQDFKDELQDAEILQIPDYQEVVAKGLAIECARRFYSREGDFASVTYNRLCLILDPDEKSREPRPFVAWTDGLPDTKLIPGLLLPSASALQNFYDRPMAWKVRLKSAPKHALRYYFLRSSYDPADNQNLLNVEEQLLPTPKDCSFDSNLQVEVTVREDGTALPRFIYKKGRNDSESVFKDGREFYFDATSSTAANAEPEAFIGLDFGTSNSSVSFVSEEAVRVFRKRATEKSWKSLNELIPVLPYPLAAPLARYFGQRDDRALVEEAFEFVESTLALASYIAFVEMCVRKGTKQTRLLKGFTQRSAGPLWNLLQACLEQLGNKAQFVAPYRDLLTPELFKQMDSAVTQWAAYKHRKLGPSEIDALKPVEILANISSRVFGEMSFGFFENVKKARFGKNYTGLFRVAHGASSFVQVLRYEGPFPFSEDPAFVVDRNTGIGLPLEPLIFWYPCSAHKDSEFGHCFIYDLPVNPKGKTDQMYSFKAVASHCSFVIPPGSTTQEFKGVEEKLKLWRDQDPTLEVVPGIQLSELETE